MKYKSVCPVYCTSFGGAILCCLRSSNDVSIYPFILFSCQEWSSRSQGIPELPAFITIHSSLRQGVKKVKKQQRKTYQTQQCLSSGSSIPIAYVGVIPILGLIFSTVHLLELVSPACPIRIFSQVESSSKNYLT